MEQAAPAAHDYWKETRLPIYSAALVLPFILIYEIGLITLRSEVINGGDAILFSLGSPLFRWMGVEGSFVSLAVLVAVFLWWQAHTQGPWIPRPQMLFAKFLESLLFAVGLFVLLGFFVQYLPRSHSHGTDAPAQRSTPSVRADTEDAYSVCSDLAPSVIRQTAPASSASKSKPPKPPPRYEPGVQDFVLYCGAGVYEELVFRVLLLGLLMLVFTKLLHMEHAYAAAWSVIAGAILFSAFHHIGGEKFETGVFVQRAFAGVYFAAIYVNRSFGVAAASHALYDILVGLNYMRS